MTYIKALGFLFAGLVSLAYANVNQPISTEVPQLSPLPAQESAIVLAIQGADEVTKRILSNLTQCESGNDPNAINKVDLDGTSSWGLLQFKPETLFYFGMKYKILPEDFEKMEIMNRIMEPELQTAVAVKMIQEYGKYQAFWKQQFPECGRIYQFWNY